MPKADFWTWALLIGQALGVIGSFVGVGMMLARRAKEQRERESTRLVARETDPRDWHGAPVSKPR